MRTPSLPSALVALVLVAAPLAFPTSGIAAYGGSWQVVERVSVASDGSRANRESSNTSLSVDGR